MNPNRVRVVITTVAVAVSVVVLYALIHPLLPSSSPNPATAPTPTATPPVNPKPGVYVINDASFSAGLPSGWATVNSVDGVSLHNLVGWEFDAQSTTAVSVTANESPARALPPAPRLSSAGSMTKISIDGEPGYLDIVTTPTAGTIAMVTTFHNGETVTLSVLPADPNADSGQVARDLIATWNWK